MKSKLSLHINAVTEHDNMIAFFRDAKPAVVKVLQDNRGFVEEARAASPDSLIVGRRWEDSPNRIADPRMAASWKFNRIRERGDYEVIDVWEGDNEPDTYHWETFVAMAVFDEHLANLLHADGKQYVALSWGEGHPPEYWERPEFPWANFISNYQKVFESADYLGVHEYGRPRMFSTGMEGWHIMRFPKWYSVLPREWQKPLIVSECGIDGGVASGPGGGWRNFTSSQSYMDDLALYDAKLAQYNVVGATVYTWGTHDRQWDSFDISGEMSRLLKGYVEATDLTPPTEDFIIDYRGNLTVHETRQFDMRPLSDINRWIVHHTASDVSVEAVARYHVNSRGWAGIGYHYYIEPDGRVLLVGSIDTVRAHAFDHNEDSVGVALQGDFTNGRPSDAQLDSLARLLATQPEWAVQAHRDVLNTICPGDWFHQWLDSFEGAPEDETSAILRNLGMLDLALEDAVEYSAIIRELLE